MERLLNIVYYEKNSCFFNTSALFKFCNSQVNPLDVEIVRDSYGVSTYMVKLMLM